jgi:Ca2+-binding RTX toxin-like protein
VHAQPSVSLKGAADDGRPGDGDNVQNVEKHTFHINATFTGSDANETIDILNVDTGSSNIDGGGGGGGNDVIKAYDTNDTVNGGAGDDQIEGGLGNDVVTGGPGKDMIMGDSSASHCSCYGSCKVPFGSDTIYAQDARPTRSTAASARTPPRWNPGPGGQVPSAGVRPGGETRGRSETLRGGVRRLVRTQGPAAARAGAALLVAPGKPQAQAAVADVTHDSMIGPRADALKPRCQACRFYGRLRP